MTQVSAIFLKNKETKNTVRYSELVEENNEPFMKEVYIQKSAFTGEIPTQVRITVEF